MARRRQQLLALSTHGGKRRGAGRKPAGLVAGVQHARRAHVSGREPVLVTLKVRRHVWNLRTRRALERLLPSFFAAKERLGVRIAHFSVERDHVHLVLEAADRSALWRAIDGLCVRFARRLNRLMGRTGRVFADRFHSRVLGTPRAVRTALAYVLCNFRKHGVAMAHQTFDPFSSAAWFDGWGEVVALTLEHAPVAAPRTWLLGIGWQRAGGKLDPRHVPGQAPS